VPKFDIETYLCERKALIDRSLERYLKQSNLRPRTIVKAMRYGVLSGGKRLRPILTLASGELFGAERKQLLPFACALELIHAYSLIHDDLPALDNDDFRRGEPATHKVFGEGIALLAGDALLTEAFRLMSRPDAVRSLKPGLVLELIHDISQAAGAEGLVGGQVVDLEAEDKQADTAAVEHIHARKTGALICVSATVGVRLGGATRQELRRVERYGRYLGLAFQIADDIMDAADQACQGSEKKKATYPSVVGLGAARKRARELLDRCFKELEPFGKNADPLRGIARFIVERAL
jgi:geranylgeranyl diphosphate synthase type II